MDEVEKKISWNFWYMMLMVFLLLQIVLYYWLTNIYS